MMGEWLCSEISIIAWEFNSEKDCGWHHNFTWISVEWNEDNSCQLTRLIMVVWWWCRGWFTFTMISHYQPHPLFPSSFCCTHSTSKHWVVSFYLHPSSSQRHKAPHRFSFFVRCLVTDSRMKYESLCMLCACAKTKKLYKDDHYFQSFKFSFWNRQNYLFYPVNSGIISLFKFNRGWTFN